MNDSSTRSANPVFFEIGVGSIRLPLRYLLFLFTITFYTLAQLRQESVHRIAGFAGYA
jgi:hypothetical protein